MIVAEIAIVLAAVVVWLALETRLRAEQRVLQPARSRRHARHGDPPFGA